MRSKILTVSAAVLALGMTAACGGGGSGSGDAASATGPIKVWLSNNPEEIAWGKAMVEEWNAAHPDEKITAQEIPAGKTSEEVIGAAITAGNAPCLVFNTSPGRGAAVREAGRPRRARRLLGCRRLHQGPVGRLRRPVHLAGREVLPDPVEAEPGDDLLQQGPVQEGRARPGRSPPLSTYDEFFAASKKIVDSGAAAVRDRAGPLERVLPVLVRLLPALRRRVRWQADDRGRQGDLRRRRGQGRLELLGADVQGRLRPARRSTTGTRSPTRRPRWRSSVRGPSRSTRTR